jgi:ABC-type phosphate transport system auxiliary subunit
MKIHSLFITISLCGLCAACLNPVSKHSAEAKQTNGAKQSSEPKAVIESRQANTIKLSPSKSSDASEFLNFAEAYSDLSAEAQKQELQATNQILTRNPNDLLHRMKLVMIYGLPSSYLAETQKAQNLLQQILQENMLANAQLAFAHLLFDHLIAVNKISKNNRDDQKRTDLTQQKNEALQQKLEATQLKLDAALQKINELKNIEKSMGEREPVPRK